MAAVAFWQYVFVIITICKFSKAYSEDYFTAAVFEHSRQGDEISDSPQTVIHTNLGFYQRAAKVAKEHAGNIIVFPEYGIFPAVERLDLKRFLEHIPNPKQEISTPCDETESYIGRPILHSLSCIAKMNEIIVVANMGGIEECNNASECPEDGVLHHNSNVVFDRNGILLARYYKERLFFEFGMDSPEEEQDPIFETDIGIFATFICFDILFKKMAQVSQESSIDAILFPTMWMNSSPFFTATQWWQAWAMGNNATLLAANLQMPGKLNVGSGIFRGREGPIATTFNPDGIPKLIISAVPKRNKKISPKSVIFAITENDTQEWNTDNERVPSQCSYRILENPQNIYRDYRCLNEIVANYTLVKLNETEDYIKL